MTSSLKPYPAYKDSGVPWLGSVPEQWNIARLKQLCLRSALYGANLPATAYSSAGVRLLRTTDITDDGLLRRNGVFVSDTSASKYILADGDLLVSRSGTIGRSFLYESRLHGPCAYAGYLVRFVPSKRVSPRYLFLFTKAQSFSEFLRTVAIVSTIENVNGEKYSNAPVPLPSCEEQSAIARYLDYMDRRIQKYIRAKQRLIALLNEQKQAIIQRAVTRGLDPNVRLKPSGVPWLGDIPEHWRVMPLKHLSVRVQNGTTPPSEHPEYYADDGLPWYGPSALRDSPVLAQAARHVSAAALQDGKARLIRGPALVVSVIGNVGRCALLLSEGSTNQQLTSFELNTERVVPEFVCRQFRLAEPWLVAAASSSTIPILDTSLLAGTPLGVPSSSEQADIVQHVKAATVEIDRVIGAAHLEIDLLREYRTRLIGDVVTGKLDVRDVAANLPDESEMPPEPSDEEPAEDMPDLESEESDDEQAET